MFATEIQAETVVITRQDQGALVVEQSAVSRDSVVDDGDRFPQPIPLWWDAHLRAQ